MSNNVKVIIRLCLECKTVLRTHLNLNYIFKETHKTINSLVDQPDLKYFDILFLLIYIHYKMFF